MKIQELPYEKRRHHTRHMSTKNQKINEIIQRLNNDQKELKKIYEEKNSEGTVKIIVKDNKTWAPYTRIRSVVVKKHKDWTYYVTNKIEIYNSFGKNLANQTISFIQFRLAEALS